MGLICGLNHLIQSLNDELPTYLSHTDNVASETNLLQWQWQPSSAASDSLLSA